LFPLRNIYFILVVVIYYYIYIYRDLLDVGRSLDDIEREDPSDPAAVDFV